MEKIGQRAFNFLLVILIIASLGLVLFFSRYILFYQYEPEYYENWYYHSQWNYPDSARGISDGELYKFVGYQLVQGENPFNINWQIPPLGKYFYGLAEKYLGNPYWVSLGFYLASGGVLFFFSKDLFQDCRLSLLAFLLFVTTPFVSTQIRETMLDLPLMFFFLTHAWLFIRYLSKGKLVYLIGAGLFLGMATGTKPGVYTPLVFLLGLAFLFWTAKRFWSLIFYLSSTLSGYLLAFFCYFLKHPNPFPWLRLHRKSLKFYLGPRVQIDHLAQWKTIFLNSYQSWWQPQKSFFGGGSLILPLGVVALGLIMFWALKKQENQWLYLVGLSLVFLIVNTLIPFFPRYLMPVIPLFVLKIVFVSFRLAKTSVKKTSLIILFLSFLNYPFLAGSLIASDPLGDSQVVARLIATRAYRELYRSLTPEGKESLSEEKFLGFYESFLDRLGTREIKVKPGEMTRFKDWAEVSYQIKYLTRYGELSYQPTFLFHRIHNQWRLVWQWDYLWPGFKPESKLVIQEKGIPVLGLRNKEGKMVARRGKGRTVWVIPRLMFKWNQHLNALAEITGEDSLTIDKRIRRVIPDEYPRFVGYLDPALGEEGRKKALLISGVSLREIDYLLPIGILSPQTTSELIHNLQREKPELFYVQAQVYLEDSQGKRVLLPFKKVKQGEVIVGG